MPSLISIFAAVFSASMSFQAVSGLATSCSPPTTPADATWGYCAFPLTEAAAANVAQVVAYFNGNGCLSNTGLDINGILTGKSCGTEANPNAIAGWTISTSFNAAGCPPGSDCY